jgi:hypothetical protein
VRKKEGYSSSGATGFCHPGFVGASSGRGHWHHRRSWHKPAGLSVKCVGSTATTTGPNSLGSNIRVCSHIHIRVRSRISAAKPRQMVLRNIPMALRRPEMASR